MEQSKLASEWGPRLLWVPPKGLRADPLFILGCLSLFSSVCLARLETVCWKKIMVLSNMAQQDVIL